MHTYLRFCVTHKIREHYSSPSPGICGLSAIHSTKNQHVHYARVETKPKQIRETVLFKLSCQQQHNWKWHPHSIVFPAEWISQELPCRGRLLCLWLPPPLGFSLTVIKERRERSRSVLSLQGRLARFPWCQASS